MTKLYQIKKYFNLNGLPTVEASQVPRVQMRYGSGIEIPGIETSFGNLITAENPLTQSEQKEEDLRKKEQKLLQDLYENCLLKQKNMWTK
jgi:hypothetical protein